MFCTHTNRHLHKHKISEKTEDLPLVLLRVIQFNNFLCICCLNLYITFQLCRWSVIEEKNVFFVHVFMLLLSLCWSCNGFIYARILQLLKIIWHTLALQKCHRKEMSGFIEAFFASVFCSVWSYCSFFNVTDIYFKQEWQIRCAWQKSVHVIIFCVHIVFCLPLESFIFWFVE